MSSIHSFCTTVLAITAFPVLCLSKSGLRQWWTMPLNLEPKRTSEISCSYYSLSWKMACEPFSTEKPATTKSNTVVQYLPTVFSFYSHSFLTTIVLYCPCSPHVTVSIFFHFPLCTCLRISLYQALHVLQLIIRRGHCSNTADCVVYIWDWSK